MGCLTAKDDIAALLEGVTQYAYKMQNVYSASKSSMKQCGIVFFKKKMNDVWIY